MSFDEQPDPLSDCMEAYDKLKAERDSLLAAMGEKDMIINEWKNRSEAHNYSPGPDLLRDTDKALSTTPQDALARLRNEIRAETFRDAAERYRHMDNGGASHAGIIKAFNALADEISGKREG